MNDRKDGSVDMNGRRETKRLKGTKEEQLSLYVCNMNVRKQVSMRYERQNRM